MSLAQAHMHVACRIPMLTSLPSNYSCAQHDELFRAVSCILLAPPLRQKRGLTPQRRGGCQAIEDAAVLGNLLAENRKTLDKPHELLATYAKIREPRTKDLATFSDSFAMLHTARLPYGMGPFVRWFLYTLVPTWFWISYLGWLYRYQPTVTALGNPPSQGKKRQ